MECKQYILYNWKDRKTCKVKKKIEKYLNWIIYFRIKHFVFIRLVNRIPYLSNDFPIYFLFLVEINKKKKKSKSHQRELSSFYSFAKYR